MKRTGQNSPQTPRSRRKKKAPTDDRARFLIEQCPHRIVGVMHLPGCDIDAPEHESHNEHAAIRLLALCNDVTKIHSQPEQVVYQDTEGKKRNYTSDFGVTLADGSVVSVEVKPLTILLRPNNQDKYMAVAKSYAANFQRFTIFTDHAVHLEPRCSIARRLRMYLASSVPSQYREAILSALVDGQKSIRQILVALDDATALANIYALIAQRYLCISWQEPFGLNMHVSLPEAPYAHLNFSDITRASRFDPLVQELALGRRPQDQRLLAAALTKDQSVSLPAPVGSVDGYSGRAMQIGRNFRMFGIREAGYSESPSPCFCVDADELTEGGDDETA